MKKIVTKAQGANATGQCYRFVPAGIQKLKILFVLFLFLSSCNKTYTREEIDKLISTGETDDLIKGICIISEQKDSSYLEEILKNAYDPRITHKAKFYSQTVYGSKMMAMESMSGLKPPKKVDRFEPDSVIVKFYTRWYEENFKNK